MDKANEYSFWIQPQGEVYDKLKSLIYDLAEKYNAPKFEPHVTLLGNLVGQKEDAIAKSRELARKIRPYKIRLTEVGCLDRYFRCIFIRAEKTKPVMEANAKAREIFGKEDEEPYMPHLSLLYGNLSQDIKDKIVEEIGKRFGLEFNVNSIYLISSSDNIPPEKWKIVKEFPLND